MPKEAYVKEAKELVRKAKAYGIHLEANAILLKEGAQYLIEQKKVPDRDKIRLNYFPLRSPEEIKKAKEWLLEYGIRLPYRFRKNAALKLLNKERETYFSKEEKNTLLKMAGLGIGERELVLKELDRRINYLNDTGEIKFASVLKELYNVVERQPWEELYKTGVMIKLAGTIDEFDNLFGLKSRYPNFLPPEDFIFSITKQHVEDINNNILFNTKTGKSYKMEELSRVSTKVAYDLFGEDFIKEAFLGNVIDKEYIREWLNETTRENAKLFDELLALSGISAYAVKLSDA